MPSFFDLQKFAATGIASPDMTAYDKARALAAFGGVKTQTLTGVPPLHFKADGKPLLSWSMLGNGQQTGTPSPQNIIMPTFCGVRTANLFDYTRTDGITDNYYINQQGQTVASDNYYISYAINVMPNAEYVWRFNAGDSSAAHTAPTVAFYDNGGTILGVASHAPNVRYFSFTTPNGCAFIKCSVYKRLVYQSEAMLNSGSTALPYEPYGYKIPLTCAGQTVPVYLGQTQTVRRIRKLVLTGEENITMPAASSFQILGVIQCGSTSGFCTHYQQISWDEATYVSKDGFSLRAASGGADRFRICDRSITTVADFKSYLAAQYAAGTPVTVWYVLATPEIAIVNEPLAKIGDYADELHSEDAGVTIPTVKGQNVLTVDTELQPSSMTITYFEEV